jgi:hypothetical protein
VCPNLSASFNENISENPPVTVLKNETRERAMKLGDTALDPEEFLERLKAEHRVLRWEPLPPDQVRRDTGKQQVRNREDLEYLHRHWALPDTFDPADAGGGVRGRVVGLVGRLVFRVLGRYLREERELISHLVRVNEALEQRCDELTVRCEQLNQDMISRQIVEASNQAKLAAWLHLEPPAAATTDRPRTRKVTGDGTPIR